MENAFVFVCLLWLYTNTSATLISNNYHFKGPFSIGENNKIGEVYVGEVLELNFDLSLNEICSHNPEQYRSGCFILQIGQQVYEQFPLISITRLKMDATAKFSIVWQASRYLLFSKSINISSNTLFRNLLYDLNVYHHYYLKISPIEWIMMVDNITFINYKSEKNHTFYNISSSIYKTYPLNIAADNGGYTLDAQIKNIIINSTYFEKDTMWDIIPTHWDHETTEQFNIGLVDIGWIKYLDCIDGTGSVENYVVYNEYYNQTQLLEFAKYAITFKIIPENVTRNSSYYSKFAVLSDICTTNVWALNNGYSVGYKLDINTLEVTGYPQFDEYIGEYEAVGRMIPRCFLYELDDTPYDLSAFFSIGCAQSIVILTDPKRPNGGVCSWTGYKDTITNNTLNKIGVYLGFDKNRDKCCRSNGDQLKYFQCNANEIPPTPPPTPQTQCKARILGKCDEFGSLYISYDNGKTFTNVINNVEYQWSMDYLLSNITSKTIVNFTCENYGYWGVFVSTITLFGMNGEIINFYTDPQMTNFSSDKNITWYEGFNDPNAIWNKQSFVNSELEPGYVYNTSWVWDDTYDIHQIITFQFDFGRQQEILNRLCPETIQIKNVVVKQLENFEIGLIIGAILLFLTVIVFLIRYCWIQRSKLLEKTIFITNPMIILIGIGIYDKEPIEPELENIDLMDLDVDVDIENLMQLFNGHFQYDEIYPEYNSTDEIKLHWKA
eukprot:524876_1